MDDTIVAIASAPGGAARGIVRLSGPATSAVTKKCLAAEVGSFEEPRRAAVARQARLLLPGFASLPPCEVLCWPAGRSYTGQSAAEIHTFGSPPLLQAIVETCCHAGARLAEPGEFTLRAFLAGRIDLTQAEAVLGVIEAAEPDVLRAALGQLAGGLATPLGRLREDLLDLLAELEAGLDFADEDIRFLSPTEIGTRLQAAGEHVAQLAERMQSRGSTNSAATVAIVGRPNVGKSSLFNALIGHPNAIVTSQPGTTRDYLTAEIEWDNVRVRLVDTAGRVDKPLSGTDTADVRAQPDEAAQTHAADQARRADLRLLCLDMSQSLDGCERGALTSADPNTTIVVWTKADLAIGLKFEKQSDDGWSQAFLVSSLTGQGLRELRNALVERIVSTACSTGEVVATTAARCRESLRLAAGSLASAAELNQQQRGEELVAAEVRTALEELGKVVGAVYTEDVLARIFSRFCIGK